MNVGTILIEPYAMMSAWCMPSVYVCMLACMWPLIANSNKCIQICYEGWTFKSPWPHVLHFSLARRTVVSTWKFETGSWRQLKVKHTLQLNSHVRMKLPKPYLDRPWNQKQKNPCYVWAVMSGASLKQTSLTRSLPCHTIVRLVP